MNCCSTCQGDAAHDQCCSPSSLIIIDHSAVTLLIRHLYCCNIAKSAFQHSATSIISLLPGIWIRTEITSAQQSNYFTTVMHCNSVSSFNSASATVFFLSATFFAQTYMYTIHISSFTIVSILLGHPSIPLSHDQSFLQNFSKLYISQSLCKLSLFVPFFSQMKSSHIHFAQSSLSLSSST